MKRITIAITGAALIVLWTADTPAYADCAADVKKIEVGLKEIPRSKASKPHIYFVEEKLDIARKLVGKKKKKKKCAKIMKVAADKLELMKEKVRSGVF